MAVRFVQFPGQIGVTGAIVTLGQADACANKLPESNNEKRKTREKRKTCFIRGDFNGRIN